FPREVLDLTMALEEMLPDVRHRVVQFIAAQPGEGSSTTALDFAAAVAGAQGRRVLLATADLRVPALRGRLKARPGACLADAALRGAPVERAVAPVGSLVAVAEFADGADPADTARLFANAEFWAALKEGYDTVVIDSPALASSAEGLVMARIADAVAIVVEAERTRAPQVQHLHQALLRVGARVAGCVLTKRRFYIPRWIYRNL
ncbi:MAG TPA: CpsD/CapB family tyrosine-protein kinase, partial [Alphaproteobacteria bacterium]|nr:CpsD/CapB family tyrosine-protein kinase [Alphaproteobacteria bacterium]